jgi:hypothetical protein
MIWFYPASRAHHAFCMAIDFGMKFRTTKGGLWEPEGLLHIQNPAYRIEIAEESLHLLEIDPKTDLTLKGIGGVPSDSTGYRDQNRIIQRDGIPFHWPEHEEIPETAAGG